MIFYSDAKYLYMMVLNDGKYILRNLVESNLNCIFLAIRIWCIMFEFYVNSRLNDIRTSSFIDEFSDIVSPKTPLCASTGPVLGRCCQHRPNTGPVLATNGRFTGMLKLESFNFDHVSLRLKLS